VENNKTKEKLQKARVALRLAHEGPNNKEQ
jgi:hypothetical protein